MQNGPKCHSSDKGTLHGPARGPCQLGRCHCPGGLRATPTGTFQGMGRGRRRRAELRAAPGSACSLSGHVFPFRQTAKKERGFRGTHPSEHAESTCERTVIKSHYLQAVGLQVKRETKGKYRFRCPHPNSRAKKDIRLRQRPACQGRRSEAVGGQSPSEREVPPTPNTEHLLLLEGEF